MRTKGSEEKLEKFIRKLENTDIREWEYESVGGLTLEKYGLRFTLGEEWLWVGNLTGNLYYISFTSDNIKDKSLRKMLKQLYTKTFAQLVEYQKRELEEKIETFLTE